MSLIKAQLPVRLTPLVGRERELDDVVRAVTRSRLVTLTGPGGTGKTRLALAAAIAAQAGFPAGVGWVELAQVEDPALTGQTVATRLDVPDTPGQDATEAVAKHVADHQLLIVLDNCEHLAEATARLAEYLLAACPNLTVLATSREALGVEGELSWQVPPLSLPQAEPAPDRGRPGQVGRGQAVRAAGAAGAAVVPGHGRERGRGAWPSASGWTGCRWPSSWPPRG